MLPNDSFTVESGFRVERRPALSTANFGDERLDWSWIPDPCGAGFLCDRIQTQSVLSQLIFSQLIQQSQTSGILQKLKTR
ncbi:MAG: hypothetical protein ACAF42_11820 [Limnothrix sp. BL-A-16]